MAPIFISPKIESPITRACLRYAPRTVLIVARSVRTVVDMFPGHQSRQGAYFKMADHSRISRTVGTVQGAYRKNACVIGDSILGLINIGAIVEQ